MYFGCFDHVLSTPGWLYGLKSPTIVHDMAFSYSLVLRGRDSTVNKLSVCLDCLGGNEILKVRQSQRIHVGLWHIIGLKEGPRS